MALADCLGTRTGLHDLHWPSHGSKQLSRSYLALEHVCISFTGPPTWLERLYWTFSALKQAYIHDKYSKGIIGYGDLWYIYE